MVQIYSSQELTESDIYGSQKLVPQIEQIGIVDSAYTEYKTGDKAIPSWAQVSIAIDARRRGQQAFARRTDSRCRHTASMEAVL